MIALRLAVILAVVLGFGWVAFGEGGVGTEPRNPPAVPNRLEWQMVGTVHAVPVRCAAEIREDGRWFLRCEHDPPPGVVRQVLDLNLEGTYEETPPHNLRMRGDYAHLDMTFQPLGGGRFKLIASNVDAQFSSITLVEGFANRHETDRATHRFYWPDRGHGPARDGLWEQTVR